MNLNFNTQQFLSQYWQKAPCLIKAGIQPFPNFISAEELAGLALESEVESRIVTNFDNETLIKHGPFTPNTFANLPESHWTLLVQSLDYWLPEINQLSSLFSFIPRWRFDDIMVSYATNGSGVGPHYDNYDVFLVQADGKRRWRAGAKDQYSCPAGMSEPLMSNVKFDPIIDAVLHPGDILYVPPLTAHWGESIGNSICYSIGFRAPQTKDLVALLAEHMETSSTDDSPNEFFTDQYRNKNRPDNEIEPELLDWAKQQLLQLADNKQLLTELLANSLSRSKLGAPESIEPDEGLNLTNASRIRLLPGINCNWSELNHQIIFSIEGDSLRFPIDLRDWVKLLASGEVLDFKGLKDDEKIVAFCDILSTIEDRGYFLYNV